MKPILNANVSFTHRSYWREPMKPTGVCPVCTTSYPQGVDQFTRYSIYLSWLCTCILIIIFYVFALCLKKDLFSARAIAWCNKKSYYRARHEVQWLFGLNIPVRSGWLFNCYNLLRKYCLKLN